MQPEIKKNEKALFRNIFGAFIFDLSLIYLLVVVISLFIPSFYSDGGLSYYNLFFIFFIFFYFINLIAGFFSSQTIGMKFYNIYFSKGFNILNLKTKIPLPQSILNVSFVTHFFVLILDIIIGIFFVFLFANFLNLGILLSSFPTGVFLIANSFDFYVSQLTFSGIFYYIFSISIWGRTPGMSLLKIRVPFYKRTITIFERYILLIVSIVIFNLIAFFFNLFMYISLYL